MKYIQITQDVWVNLDKAESITRNIDGTALIQGFNRVYQTVIPFEAVILKTLEEDSHREEVPQTQIQSPLISNTEPAW